MRIIPLFTAALSLALAGLLLLPLVVISSASSLILLLFYKVFSRADYLKVRPDEASFKTNQRLDNATDRAGNVIYLETLRLRDFENAEIDNVSMNHRDLSDTSFENANLAYSNLSFADLDGASFEGAILCNADLRGTNLSQAELTGSYYNRETFLPFSESTAKSLGMIKLAS